MTFSSAVVIGFFLGFGFGVGCALAVMYSIYMGGYRAGVREANLPTASQRLRQVRKRIMATQGRSSVQEEFAEKGPQGSNKTNSLGLN